MKITKHMAFVICLAAVGCGNERDDVEVKQGDLIGYGNCPPFNVDQACACTDPNGNGQCAVLTPATRFYANLSTFTNPDIRFLNDHITSISVGPNASLMVCKDPGYTGFCGRIGAGTIINNLHEGLGCPFGFRNFGFSNVCMDDTITSIRLDPTSYNCQAPGANQTSIFLDPNFTGDCVVLDVGTYRAFDRNPPLSFVLGAYGLKNRSISSLKNGSGVYSIWYNNIDLGAPSFTSVTNTTYTTMGSHDDWISSIQVLQNP